MGTVVRDVCVPLVVLCGAWYVSVQTQVLLCGRGVQREQHDNRVMSYHVFAEARRRLQDEIHMLNNHAWAGVYYRGDGLSANDMIMIAPNAGFYMESSGCLGVYSWSYGEVCYANGKVELKCHSPRKGADGSSAFVVTRWGARGYLIPEEKMIEFCNQVNSGLEPRASAHGDFFLRSNEWKTVPNEMPLISSRYARYLLENPITAEITKVQPSIVEEGRVDSDYRRTWITVNCGSRAGILPEMKLYVFRDFGVLSEIEVITVQKDMARAILIQDPLLPEPLPQRGWGVTTLHPIAQGRRK